MIFKIILIYLISTYCFSPAYYLILGAVFQCVKTVEIYYFILGCTI